MDVISSIKKQLLDCEYPHRWQQERPVPRYSDLIDILNGELLDTLLEDHPFSYLIIYVVLAYEHGLLEETERAIEVLRIGEKKFSKIILENGIVRNFSPAFLHILKSTEVFLLEQKGDICLALEVLSKISVISSMNIENRAAAQHGFRALFHGYYGENGTKKAVDCLNEAISMNPTESLWYYMKAEYIKRFIGKDPFYYKTFSCEDEFESLNEALKIKRCSLYTSLASVMYRRASYVSFRYKIKGVNSGNLRKLNDESMNLLIESMQLNPNCAETLFRCGEGFRRLPYPHRDTKESKRLLDEGLKLSPYSSYGNHLMSRYYEMVKEPQNAIPYLKICVERKMYLAFMDQIRMKLTMNETVDVVQSLEDMLDIFMYHWDRVRILYELVCHSMFVLHDLRKTCEYATRLIDLGDCSSSYLQHDPPQEAVLVDSLAGRKTDGSLKLGKPMYELLMDKIKAIQDEELTPEDQNYYNDFLNLLVSEKDESAKMFHVSHDQYMYKVVQRLLSTKMSDTNLESENKNKGLKSRTTSRPYSRISHNRIPSTSASTKSYTHREPSTDTSSLWRSRGLATTHKSSRLEEASADGRQDTNVGGEKGLTIGHSRKDVDVGDVVFAMSKVKVDGSNKSTTEKRSPHCDSEDEVDEMKALLDKVSRKFVPKKVQFS